jgi:methionine aminopeptidase
MRYDMPLPHPAEPSAAAEDYDNAVQAEAGCPDTTCADLNTCSACGRYICPDHTPDATTCVDIGDHHDGCLADCQSCADVRALELVGGL